MKRLQHRIAELESMIGDQRVTDKLASHLWAAILNSIGVGIIVLDRDLRYVVWNQFMETSTGVSAERVLGRRTSEVFPHLERTSAIDLQERALGGETFHTTNRIHSDEETDRSGWGAVVYGPVHDDDGQIIGIIGIIQDITDLKETTEALRKSENKYRQLVEMANDGIAILQDEKIRYVNPRLAEMGGYAITEIEDTPFIPYIWSEDRETIRDYYRRRIVGEKVPSTYELTLMHQTGKRIPIEISAELIQFDGRPADLVIVRDISERKRTEARLKESEQRFRGLADSIPDLFFSLDKNLHYTYWNRVSETATNISTKDALGRSLYDIFPDVRGTPADLLYRRVLETGQVETIENEFLLNGILLVFELTAYPWEDGIAVLARDITGRKQSEEALRASEEKYRSLFEESGDAIFLATAEGKLLDINPAGVELFGYRAREEMLNLDIREDLFFRPSDRDRYQAVLERNGQIRDYELVLKTSTGEKLVVLETTTVIRDSEGSIVEYRGIMRDVTHQRQLQAQLIQSQKMESVGRLAGGIAHDFNNALTVILGNAQLLQSEIGTSGSLSKRLVPIMNAAEHAESLTRQLLAFSRKQVVNPRVLNLNEVMSHLASMLRGLIGEDITLTIRQEAVDRILIDADPGQIEQIVINLVANAREAMPAGGVLSITTGEMELDDTYVKEHAYTKAGKYALITVSDTGCGISEEDREKIFEPFFTTKETGTGLGLATVYGIVKQNRGSIEIESQPGEGTTFKVYFPLSSAEEPEAVVPAVFDDHEPGTETILVVEDDEAIRNLTREFLTQMGYSVHTCRDVDEALTVCDDISDGFHLLLTDVVMPGRSGVELAEILQERYPTVKVLFMSGYTHDTLLRRGVVEKRIPILVKPFTSSTLRQAVRNALQN